MQNFASKFQAVAAKIDKILQGCINAAPCNICDSASSTTCYTAWNFDVWRRGVAVERRTRDREVVGSSLDRALRRKNSGQVSHT